MERLQKEIADTRTKFAQDLAAERDALKETNAKQAQAILSLQTELNEARRQVQTIAEKALESASGARALAEVQGVIASRDYTKGK